MKHVTKVARINQVLEWSTQGVAIPDDLSAGLTPGIARPGMGFITGIDQLGYIIEFVEQWKEQEPSEQDRLLADPWAFKDFMEKMSFRSRPLRNKSDAPRRQRYALCHLVFPNIFEGIASTDHKDRIAWADSFARYVTDSTDDVDRKIQQIRQGIEAEHGKDIDFYEPDIRAKWNPETSPWDEFIRLAQAMVNAGIIEIEGENEYKSDIGKKLSAARDALLKGSPEWPQLLRVGLTHIHHPLPWRASGRFRDWINESPDHALDVLQAFWAEGDLSVTDRIRSFSSVLPRDVATRPGVFTNLASVLMMGLNAERYPPFKIRAFREAYQRTEYEMPEQELIIALPKIPQHRRTAIWAYVVTNQPSSLEQEYQLEGV